MIHLKSRALAMTERKDDAEKIEVQTHVQTYSGIRNRGTKHSNFDLLGLKFCLRETQYNKTCLVSILPNHSPSR